MASAVVSTLFDPRRLFHRPHALTAVTNVVLIESRESSAAAALAVHVVIGTSFEGDEAFALAYWTFSVLVHGAGSVTGCTTYCKKGLIVHRVRMNPLKYSQMLSARSRMDLSSDIFALSNP
jgi:hypothetical protein